MHSPIVVVDRERANQNALGGKSKAHSNEIIKNLKNDIKKLKSTKVPVTTSLLQRFPELRYLEREDYQKILEHLQQKIYDKAILNDKLCSTRRMNEQKLSAYGINLSSRRDLIHKKNRRIAVDNQTQHFALRFVTVRHLHEIYKRMIYLLRKDQLHFGGITESLENDNKAQRACFRRVREMDQSVGEEVANLRQDYKVYFMQNQTDILMQSDNMRDIKNQIEILMNETQTLIRSDSFRKLNLGIDSNESIHRDTELEKQTKELDKLLQRMKDVTLVPDFEGILPRVLQQLRQNDLLQEEQRSGQEALELMIAKKSHGFIILSNTINAGFDQVAETNFQKLRLEKEYTVEVTSPLSVIDKERDKSARKTIELYSCLGRLCMIANHIHEIEHGSKFGQEEVSYGKKGTIVDKARHLLGQLTNKSSHAIERSRGRTRKEEKERALAALSKRLTRLKSLFDDDRIPQVIPELEPMHNDPDVPSRKEIKNASRKICEVANANPFDLPTKGRKKREK